MKYLPIALNENQYKFLNEQSQRTGSSKASILRNLLADYMEAKHDTD